MQIEQNAKQGSAAVDTPQVTGGDAGHVDGLSTDGNLSKGEDSQEISNAKPGVNGDCNDTLIAGDKLNTDGNAIDGSIKMEVGRRVCPGRPGPLFCRTPTPISSTLWPALDRRPIPPSP